MRGVPWNGELFDWTPKRVKRMCELFHKGHPATAIARMIGAPSRNSVVGKLNRLGIYRNMSTRVSTPDIAKARARSRTSPIIVRKHGNRVFEQSKPNHGPIKLQALPGPSSKLIRLIDASPNACRWIPGETDGPNTLICGAMQRDGSSYCAHHERRSRAA